MTCDPARCTTRKETRVEQAIARGWNPDRIIAEYGEELYDRVCKRMDEAVAP